MTALGKTLVFFNLLFSVIVGGLIVSAYVTRTNWKNGYDEAVKQGTAAVAARNAMEKQLQEERGKFDARIKQMQGENAAVLKERNEKIAELTNLTDQLRLAQNHANVERVNAASATSEISHLASERDLMKAHITDRDNIILKLEVANKDFRNRAVAAEIARNATQERLDKLMMSYEHMMAQLNDLRQRGIVPPAGQGDRTAPVEVRGKVLGAADDLATISLGSDHGLKTGNLLQVYRMSPSPTWVGTLQVVKTEPHYALGKFTPNGRNVIRKDDIVDSKILSK